MTGYEHKCLHLSHDAASTVSFRVEVDFLGTGRWQRYAELPVEAGGYAHHEFPAGFSAHWVRVVPGQDCRASAQLVYT
jgi:predicted aminopeptidase